MFKTILNLLLLATVVTSCGPLAQLETHPRDEDFFNQYVNSVDRMPTIASKLNEAQLLVTDDNHRFRIALFSNNKFYYQVDQLGEGFGDWSYNDTDGTLKLHAVRPIFDMRFTVSGKNETGSEMLVRYFDRHGFNAITVTPQGPQLTLPVYKYSDKGI